MPITPTYPGVYIQELASDVRTIVPVDTATTAFIGRALRGLVNEPVTIFGFEEFESQFGGLWIESKLGYAVRDFFLNGGSKAIIVRVFNPAATGNARAALKQLSAHTAPAGSIDLYHTLRERRTVAALNTAAGDALTLAQKPKADADKAKADADKAKADADKAKADADTALQVAQKAVAEAGESATDAQKATLKQAQEAATAKTAAAKQATADQAAAAERVANLAASDALAKAVQTAAGQTGATVASILAAAQQAIVDLANKATAATISLQAKSPGAWGNRLAARITAVDQDVSDQLADQYGVLPQELFNLLVRDTRTGDEEVYTNVTFGPGQRQLHKVLKEQSSLVEADGDAPADSILFVPHGKVTGKLHWWDDEQTASIVPAANAANDGDPITDTIVLGDDDAAPDGEGDSKAEPDGEAVKRGIQALDQADIFNMLCIPPYDSSDTVSPDVLAEAAAYCEKRRAMLIVDPPADWTSWNKAQKGFPIQGLAPSANAAVFFPRIRKRNPLRDNQLDDFVPCGAVAGVMARTDFRRGVWKAAAGLEATLNGVEGFSVQVDDNANGQLNPKGINCLRVMPAAGPVVWGARTTVGDDRLANQWKYIPVRRMALWIEETLYRSTQWAVFEPNDEPLWSSLRLNIGNFMNGLFRQGAFQGKSPAEAYFVRCDASTTTQTDIDRGIVNVIVGFAPLKPAEFVVISIKQITNQGAAA
jgi:phage tail sheath protein FI